MWCMKAKTATYTPTSAGSLTAIVSNGNCSVTSTAVTVNALPIAGITITETSGTANDGTVCAGSAITLQATGGTAYNWTLPDNTTSTTNPQIISSAAAADAGTYTVSVTDINGCSATSSITITITPSTTNTTTISACDSYTWGVNGTTYTTSGTYNSVSGCHTEILVLTIT